MSPISGLPKQLTGAFSFDPQSKCQSGPFIETERWNSMSGPFYLTPFCQTETTPGYGVVTLGPKPGNLDTLIITGLEEPWSPD